MGLKLLMNTNRNDLAILLGNGINQFNAAKGQNSWNALLAVLARTYLAPSVKGTLPGISHVEFFEALELAYNRRAGEPSLTSKFVELMASWLPMEQHGQLTQWAQKNQVPILTTNFESTLGEASASKLQRPRNPKFTHVYPWELCYSTEAIESPCEQFGIWHVHGMAHYPTSIRLGLSQYMGAVHRAHAWLYGGSGRLFSDPGGANWSGANTWLQIFMHKPLLILGQGLTETEIFLRWLLLQRIKYFKAHEKLAKGGWYIYKAGDINPGKDLFLRSVGIKPVAVDSYDEMYGPTTWRLRRI